MQLFTKTIRDSGVANSPLQLVLREDRVPEQKIATSSEWRQL